MPESFSRGERSAIMARVKSQNTSAERAVRGLFRAMGVKFRGHRQDLPGSPDFALPEARVAVFVHGCFWHQHSCKRGNRQPATNLPYWTAKLARNVDRDRRVRRQLRRLGWRVLTIWECQIKQPSLQARIARCLSTDGPTLTRRRTT
jgi:DNA mismatch endonuclease (patch repair protein)